jgi:hypothetical protein
MKQPSATAILGDPPMNLITIRCLRPEDRHAGAYRLVVAVAASAAEAVQLCRAAYGGEGYDQFRTERVVDGEVPGPAQVFGYAGQTPSLQRKS